MVHMSRFVHVFKINLDIEIEKGKYLLMF
ncbi:hypothetical protein LINPERPRIM_LOCUS35226 [Linum perenne]